MLFKKTQAAFDHQTMSRTGRRKVGESYFRQQAKAGGQRQICNMLLFLSSAFGIDGENCKKLAKVLAKLRKSYLLDTRGK